MPKKNTRLSEKKAVLKQSNVSQNARIQSRLKKLERERRRNLLQKSLGLKEKDYPKFVSKIDKTNAKWLFEQLRNKGIVEGKASIRAHKYEELLQQLAARLLEIGMQRKT
jgi:hypothetical protein